jgi:alanyl-tRNA synthetase
MTISSREIRTMFLDYFAQSGHKSIVNHSLVPDSDPTLLFVNSGMAPLKPYFRGTEIPPNKRLVNCQRCVRTNDIESVGDHHHLTFFEMLGNWSIADYFKADAVRFAWQAITKVFGFDATRIYATIYGGDAAFPNVPPDDETRRIWSDFLPADRIVPLGADSNLWGPAGDTGPCGPCTEVFFDRGTEYGCGKTDCGPGCNCSRYLEIWNAGVFMEYDMAADKSLSPLPFVSVDAGAGLERFAVILQGVDSVYSIDSINPVVEALTAGTSLTSANRSIRILTDHVRCGLFMAMDGVVPANIGREYVMRRILRRMLLHVHLSKLPERNITEAIAAVVRTKSEYDSIVGAAGSFSFILDQERSTFSKAMARGLREFDKVAAKSDKEIAGAEAFRLHESLGLPLEMTVEIAKARGLSVDEAGYHSAFEAHRTRSRGGK